MCTLKIFLWLHECDLHTFNELQYGRSILKKNNSVNAFNYFLYFKKSNINERFENQMYSIYNTTIHFTNLIRCMIEKSGWSTCFELCMLAYTTIALSSNLSSSKYTGRYNFHHHKPFFFLDSESDKHNDILMTFLWTFVLYF